jgi:hypothetical protein
VQATLASALTYAELGPAACVGELAETAQRLSQSADAAEGVQSFVERRAAVFQGR